MIFELWCAARGGLGGAGPLPEAGGLLDQPAFVMAAFAVMGAAAREIEKEG